MAVDRGGGEDELREKVAEACHDAMPWCYGQDLDGEDIYKPWGEAPESVKGYYLKQADAALAVVESHRKGGSDG